MSFIERVAKASDRFYDRMRSGKALDVATTAPTGSIDDLKGRKYCVVVTYKKSGEPVPSPVWFGVANGKLYFETGAYTVKLKRIARNPEVRVAASTTRGKPVSAPFAGTARVVESEDEDEAERIVQSNYGLFRRLYHGMGEGVTSVYVEVTPSAG
jgi:PPOX class probable F420-dependent enzyme